MWFQIRFQIASKLKSLFMPFLQYFVILSLFCPLYILVLCKPDNVYTIIWGRVTYHLHSMNYLFASMCILCSPKTCINLDWDETEVCFEIQRLCSQLIDVHLQIWNTEIPPVPPVCNTFPMHNGNGLFCHVELWHFPEEKKKKKSVFLIIFYSWVKMKLFKWWCYRGTLV